MVLNCKYGRDGGKVTTSAARCGESEDWPRPRFAYSYPSEFDPNDPPIARNTLHFFGLRELFVPAPNVSPVTLRKDFFRNMEIIAKSQAENASSPTRLPEPTAGLSEAELLRELQQYGREESGSRAARLSCLPMSAKARALEGAIPYPRSIPVSEKESSTTARTLFDLPALYRPCYCTSGNTFTQMGETYFTTLGEGHRSAVRQERSELGPNFRLLCLPVLPRPDVLVGALDKAVIDFLFSGA